LPQGFAAYFCSNVAFYYSPVIRAQYAARHHGLTPTAQFNDITFALHGLVLSVITVSQYLLARPLWGFRLSPGARPSRFTLGIAAGCVLGVAGTCFVVAGAQRSGPGGSVDPASDWCELDVVYAVGYVKIVVTLVKYTPQLIVNWRNQSTHGWSIWTILLDIAGGVLSVTQQAIDSYIQRDWSGITGNPVKFALGNVSIIYDIAFIIQHYVLYRHAPVPEHDPDHNHGESRRLLDGEDDEERSRRRLD
jgi:cystinosin